MGDYHDICCRTNSVGTYSTETEHLADTDFYRFLCSVVVVGLYFIGVVLQLDNIFSAQYFIPIFGILMGNMLSSNVIALNTYYSGLKREQQLYRYLLEMELHARSSGTIYKTGHHQVIQSFDCEYCSDGIGGSAGYDDRTNFGRKQSECGNQISDDDYGYYLHGFHAVTDDYYFTGFPKII